MSDERPKLKDDYTAANCCQPSPGDEITGYYSHDRMLKVHRTDCPNLRKADNARLVTLDWSDILAEPGFSPDDDYRQLDTTDFRVLAHHEHFGIDYAHVVARRLNISKEDAFERHRKLRDLGLLERVDATMVQYRKGIVPNRWIKHRNHSYYDLTPKGQAYLNFYRTSDA